MATINIVGTGGIIEGNLGAADVDVNLDPAVSFDSSDDKITTGNLGSLGQATSISSFAWVKLDVAASTSQYIWSTLYQPCNFVFSGANGLRFQGKRGDTDALVSVDSSGPHTFETGVWYHVGFTYNNSSRAVLFYINGVQYAGGTFPAALKNVNTDLLLGNYGAGTNMIQGNLADVKIFNSVISATDAKILAAKINQPPTLTSANANVIGWWKINDNNGSIADFTNDTNGGTDHNGTLANGTWDYDAFSVDVQNTMTTTGDFEISQGKVEGKDLTSISFDGTDDVVKSSGSTDIMNDKDATLSFWYKGGSPGTAKTILESNNNYNEALIYSRNGSEMRMYSTTGATNEFGLDSTQVTASGLYNGGWHQVIWVLDHGGQSHVIYVDGVSYPVTNITANNHTVDWNGISIGGEYNDLNGSMRDVRFYDYHLSADQAASLYSGSYNVTPLWWWKLDEGTGNVSNSGSNGTTEDLTVTNATWVNGTLDLDGTLTIAANGTLSAPRGTLEMGGTFHSNATHCGNQFIHNNGEVEFDGSGNRNLYGGNNNNGTIFYNLTQNNDTDAVDAYERYTVVKKLTNKASATWYQNQGSYVYIGEVGTNGEMEVNGTWQFSSGTTTSKITGLNTNAGGAALIDWNGVMNNGGVKIIELDNVNVDGTFTTAGSSDITFKLTGDCEFDAFTVASGDRIDINGQRAEFSGTLDVNGTIYNTAGSSSVKGQIWGNAIQTMGSNNAAHCDLISDGGYFDADQTTHNTIFMRSGTHTIGGTRDWGPTPLIVGGTTNFNATNTWGDITITNGGIFTGNDELITCEGDFTTTGGLLGASCMDQGITATRGDAADALRISGDRTIEFWFKHNSGNRPSAGNHMNLVWKNNYGYSVRLDENGKIDAGIISGASTNVVSATAVDDGKWHHIAWVFDESTADTGHKIYIDGKLDAQATSGAGNTGSGVTLTIGTGTVNSYMDEVRLWDDVRTQTEIRANMFTEVTSGAIAVYNFNEGTGGTAADAIGSLDLTLSTTGEWPAAGTFNRGSSKIHMSGANGTMTIPHNFYVHDLQAADSGETTTISIAAASNDLNIDGTLTLGGGVFSDGSTNLDLIIAGNESPVMNGSTFANIDNVIYWCSGATNITGTTYNDLQAGNGRAYTASGNIICAGDFNIISDSSFKTDGYNLTTKTYTNEGTSSLERTSSLIFTDASGCGFGSSSGTLNCKGSAGATFDGLENEMAADSNPLPGSGPFTYTCWFRTSKTGISNGIADFTSNSARGMFIIHSNDKPFIYLGDSNYRYWDAATSYLDGDWHHISLYVPGYAQADVASITLHIDGNLINTSTTVSTGAAQQPTMAQLKIGGGYSSNNNWDGDLADVRIFEKALTAGNLTTLRSVSPSKANATSYPDIDNDIGATHWWKLNESNLPSDDAADSVGSIACSVTGAVPNKITMTSSAGGTPTNFWDMETTMTVTSAYTTFTKYHDFIIDNGSSNTITIDNCTFTEWRASGNAFWADNPITWGSFTNNTWTHSGTPSSGLRFDTAYAAFDNIDLSGCNFSSGVPYDVKGHGVKLEFTNSNFDIDKVSNSSGGSVISKDHNDTANLYEITSDGTVSYSAVTNEFGVDADVKLRKGILTMNEDNKVCDTFNVYTNGTIRVTDGNDLYVQGTFDNDGTWTQTAGYGGDIHVGDFTPFDSGDIIDNTDFVDTGFHDTSHYLEMDL